MGHLFAELGKRLEDNARREIEVYRDELPEFRALRGDAHARTLEYAVWLRRRTNELAPEGRPLTVEDLAFIASMGRLRGGTGMSRAAHERVLALHTSLMLREIHEATGLDDGDELLRLMGWFGPQGKLGTHAYRSGYAEGQRRRLPVVARVQMIVRSLLDDKADTVSELMRGVGMYLHERYLVTVVRIPDRSCPGDGRRDEIVEALLRHHPVPILWHEPDELVALVPDGDRAEPPHVEEPADSRMLLLMRDFSGAVGRPCAFGTSPGPVHALAEAFARARAVSRVAPLQAVPRSVHTMADVFVELGVTHVPQIDEWLGDVVRQLSRGPDLVTTLDAYYRSDMNRLVAAATLHIHPRTLDYRLQRVRELCGLSPGSTRGIRILSTAVTRALAGARQDGHPRTP